MKIQIEKILEQARKSSFPKQFRPMMAKTSPQPFDRKGWIYEIKWDGYRSLAFVRKDGIEILSRNLKSFNQKFPLLVSELEKLKAEAVLDGEVVIVDQKGRPNFQALQDFEQKTSADLRYFVFDLIYFDGYDLSQLPLILRKQILEMILPKSKIIKYCDHVENQGKRFFERIVAEGIEGAMAKDGQSRYFKNKRSFYWQKIKNFKSRDAIIVGFTDPRGGRKHLGSLILAAYNSDELYYIGHVGTGFDDKMLESLHRKLNQIVTSSPPVKLVPKTHQKTHWVKPEYVCEIKYNEMTKENILRQPSFIRLRDDMEIREVKL